ncbi:MULTISPECIES: CDGSH iron-sulfur domain-containing protein [Streptomyces]|uniref:CDGSH iron-sulfur domain-containing protein n=1 Tax=Streptomyces TaxID=1883 RepID=UPI0005E5E485|nr:MULTISPECIES: CDGSH iron-sulfur domain-containing protein [Streptomyces]KIX73552.1 (Fe-S) protein [Streptomyces sp. MBRL 601]WTD02523.1 CDGSH iron-sulfur domain-containing protein [Streptomyces albidoflavus]
MPSTPERPTRVRLDPDGGPLLVDGPVEVVAEDGTTHFSHRPTVAVCTCRRSARYPWCDTSHRARAPEKTDTPDSPEEEPR